MQQQQQFLLVAVLLWSVLFIAQACEDEVQEQTPPIVSEHCKYTSMPTRNKFITHKVEGNFECEVINRYRTRAIMHMGDYTLNVRSPRYPKNYRSNWLVYYNVSCDEGYHMILKFRDLKLQEKRLVRGKKQCIDYVKISAPSIGSEVYCGKGHKGYPQPFNSPKGEAFITFRTDRDPRTTYRGFSIEVKCYKHQESSAMEANCEPEQVKRLSSITTRLYQLHQTYSKGAHLLSDAEFGEMLKLGIEAGESCNPMARAVGTEALKLFPEEFVKHYKTTAKNKEEDPDYSDI